MSAHPQRRGVAVRDEDVAALQRQIQSFVRSFGLLVTKATPCGHPVSPSYAHSLMVLLEREAAQCPTSQSDLGARLGIDKSNVTRLCERLHAQGHAVQTQSADDGRSRNLRLTAKGRRMAEQIAEASFERFRRVAHRLPRHELPALIESLVVLNAAVETLREDA
jgi:DNA-binding MarR family transcriptional regulator